MAESPLYRPPLTISGENDIICQLVYIGLVTTIGHVVIDYYITTAVAAAIPSLKFPEDIPLDMSTSSTESTGRKFENY